MILDRFKLTDRVALLTGAGKALLGNFLEIVRRREGAG